jgi:hypothetical protein
MAGQEGWHVCVVVADVEADTEFAGFEGITGFAADIQHLNVLKVEVRKDSVVLNDERWSLEPSNTGNMTGVKQKKIPTK